MNSHLKYTSSESELKQFPVLLCMLVSLCLILGSGQEVFAEKKKPKKVPIKLEIGWAEKVKVYPSGASLHAKLAPGDESSSIHALKIKPFKKEKRHWVRFVVTDRTGKEHKLEREILREIKTKATKKGGKGSRKYLVQLGICIGTRYEEVEFRLADRSMRQQRMILGRNVLAGNFTIDPSQSFTSEPECKTP